jgi:prevent-host-death family protein
MINIRPVSDLRNKFTDIEKTVSDGEPVFLTKNGYGSMVVMSIDAYSKLTQNVEQALDEADEFARNNRERMTHEEVFGQLRSQLNG